MSCPRQRSALIRESSKERTRSNQDYFAGQEGKFCKNSTVIRRWFAVQGSTINHLGGHGADFRKRMFCGFFYTLCSFYLCIFFYTLCSLFFFCMPPNKFFFFDLHHTSQMINGRPLSISRNLSCLFYFDTGIFKRLGPGATRRNNRSLMEALPLLHK